MKKLVMYSLAIISLLALLSNRYDITSAEQAKKFTGFTDKAALEKHVAALETDLNDYVRQKGIDQGITYRILLLTTPAVSVTIARDTMLTSYYDELDQLSRGWFTGLSGGDQPQGKVLFEKTFNWFYVPHEVAHGLLYTPQKAHPEQHYQNEMAANEFATLYWRERGYDESLADLHSLIKNVLAQLPKPELPLEAGKPISEIRYFNEYYNQILAIMDTDPVKGAAIYGYYQFKMLDEILSRRKTLTLANWITKNSLN